VKPTVAELVEKLVAHGSVQQIVDYLKQEEIQGVPQDEKECVIAEYVMTRTGLERVKIIPTPTSPTAVQGLAKRGIAVPSVSWQDKSGSYSIPLPEVLDELALRFDQGDFPELELREADD
jgi:hypothetical protein